jgi:hypothetical protein
MADTLDLIKLDLLSEYERSGRIEIADWVSRHPAHREELLDFWMWVKGTRATSADLLDDIELIDSSDVEVYEKSLTDACLAVTFGAQWLKPAIDPDEAQLESLATELEDLRGKPQRARDSRVAFRKAVVCTWIVSRLQQTRPRVTRLATQKVAYLVEQAMSLNVFVQHDRKPLGPYDRNLRYKDAEPIAREKGWLLVSGTKLKATEDLSGLSRFLPAYIRSEQLAARLVDRLARFSDDQLETIATVHWITRELDAEDRALTVETVTKALADTPEWKAKLSRSNFSSAAVRDALFFLGQLRLVQTKTT